MSFKLEILHQQAQLELAAVPEYLNYLQALGLPRPKVYPWFQWTCGYCQEVP